MFKYIDSDIKVDNSKYNLKLPHIYVMTKWMANNYIFVIKSIYSLARSHSHVFGNVEAYKYVEASGYTHCYIFICFPFKFQAYNTFLTSVWEADKFTLPKARHWKLLEYWGTDCLNEASMHKDSWLFLKQNEKQKPCKMPHSLNSICLMQILFSCMLLISWYI